MNNLKDKVIENIESVISSNLNGCTAYKYVFNDKTSVSLNQTPFDGEYVLQKSNVPKVAVFYSICVDSVKILFLKFLTTDSGTYSKAYTAGLFDKTKLTEIITTGFSEITF